MTIVQNYTILIRQIVEVLQTFRKRQPLFALWTVGRLLVQEEQRRGRPWSLEELAHWSGLLAESVWPLSPARLSQVCRFYRAFPDWSTLHPELSWTHYHRLLRLPDAGARSFYLQQAAAGHWSTREMERQIRARSFERTTTIASPGHLLPADAPSMAQLIKDTYVLEFIRLPEGSPPQERELEQALLDQLQYFLLELGTGFAFVARQKRLVTESGKQFFIDLVFYHVLRKCYVLIDLKIGELSHRDIGQMDMYVRLYDDKYRGREDGPTAGIILCTEKDHTLVKYSLLEESSRLFASTYVLYLP